MKPLTSVFIVLPHNIYFYLSYMYIIKFHHGILMAMVLTIHEYISYINNIIVEIYYLFRGANLMITTTFNMKNSNIT
jgi:hypothetical protein